MSLLPFAQESRFVMPSQKQSGEELQDCGELAIQRVRVIGHNVGTCYTNKYLRKTDSEPIAGR